MSKNIWIFNHYAGPPSISTGLRHYNFGKYLIKAGYDVTVFAASTVHNSDMNLIEKKGPRYIEDDSEGVPFVFIKARPYKGNGKDRVLNMVDYYRNLFKVIKKFEKPDIIYASSVHPLACVAGIRIAKKMKIPCICETRDIWPESIVEFNGGNPKSLAIRLVDCIVKWTFKKADALIFTMEGGKQYIRDKHWHDCVSLDKVYYLNNGVDLEEFDKAVSKSKKSEEETFNFIYAGSLRRMNDIDLLLDASKAVQKLCPDIRVWIYGQGEDMARLQARIEDECIDNVCLKGRIPKNEIPDVLAQAYAAILHYNVADIWKYGGSQNKLFEYLAAGRPVIGTMRFGYDIIETYGAGETAVDHTPEGIAAAMAHIRGYSKEQYDFISKNARAAAKEFDFKNLSQRLIEILDQTIETYRSIKR